jgi:hypothetical protein
MSIKKLARVPEMLKQGIASDHTGEGSRVPPEAGKAILQRGLVRLRRIQIRPRRINPFAPTSLRQRLRLGKPAFAFELRLGRPDFARSKAESEVGRRIMNCSKLRLGTPLSHNGLL